MEENQVERVGSTRLLSLLEVRRSKRLNRVGRSRTGLTDRPVIFLCMSLLALARPVGATKLGMGTKLLQLVPQPARPYKEIPNLKPLYRILDGTVRVTR